MELYIGQKADQALEAMCGHSSLDERVKMAKMHFASIANDHFLKTAPEDIREIITALMSGNVGGDLTDAQLVKSAILSILTESGREQEKLSQKLSQLPRASKSALAQPLQDNQ